MSNWIDWISSQAGTLLDGLREFVDEWNGCCDTRGDTEKLRYYEDLLQDMQQIELKFGDFIPSLKDKILTLKLEVRYILPYVTCRHVTNDKAYEETKRCFRLTGCPKGLVNFVEYLTEQALVFKPVATDFYLGASIGEGEYDWCKFADYVLENLKYAQSLDGSQAINFKGHVKLIEESLRFVRNFVKLAAKWNFSKLNNIESKIHDIYETLGSVSLNTALIFSLINLESVDESTIEAVDLRFSEVEKKIYGSELQAKGVYFDILALLKLCLPDTCSLECETLHRFIESLQNILQELPNYLVAVRNSREGELQEMIEEMEFLKIILKGLLDDLADHGKLHAIATHIDVLTCEAESAVYSYVRELEEQACHQERKVSLLGLGAKISQIKHEIRQTNKKDEILIFCFIEDFLDSLQGCMACKVGEHAVMLELGFCQSFHRCTNKWCIDHPQLRAVRIHTENVVRQAWWDIRCFSFRKTNIGEKVVTEEIESHLSDMVQKLTLNRPFVEEICIKIRDLKPSSPCRLCKKFGLDFADFQCTFLRSRQTCEPNAVSQETSTAADMAVLFGSLHHIAGNLLIERRRPDGLLVFLEDLIDRAACLSYLQLVDKADQTASLEELLLQIDDPEVSMSFSILIACQISKVQYSMLPLDVLMLFPAKFMIQIFEGLISTNANIVTSMKDHVMKDHVETVLKDLILLRCILEDPLKQYFEQEDLDELLNDIGAGIIEAGVFFLFTRVDKSKENIFFRVKDVVLCFRATVRQVYFKFTTLSPSKLPMSETGSLNILLGNLMKPNKFNAEHAGFPGRQIQDLHDDLQVCNSFLIDTTLKQDGLGLIKRLRTRIMSVGCKVENSIDTFDEVPVWFFKMRLFDFTVEAKLIIEEVKAIRLSLLADVGSSETTVPKSETKAKTPKVQHEVIGYEDVEEELIRQLTTGSQLLEIIPVVGMPGSGKTTLAMKVYEAVGCTFQCSAWCYVSQNYQKKGLLIQIIDEIDGQSEGINELSEEDLAHKLYQSLMKKKDYLIVLDDVWDIEAWNQLRMCFPPGNNRNRIILTSRSKVVGLHAANSDHSCISLKLLSPDKSQLLLEKNVFGAKGFPEHLQDIGMEIAEKCGGLPLSIILIAGVLKNIKEDKEEWGQVWKNLDSLVQYQDGVSDKLELSYKHLPIHLKQCFLYCGGLVSTPIRHREIRRSKLLQLWVAERLIEKTEEQSNLDEAAESCLMDLISRSLLIVAKKGSDGRVRTCRIHDLLRDFCIRKGHDEQFWNTSLDVLNPFPNWQRRLSICLHMLAKVKHPIWSKPRTRSLIHNECNIVCMFINYGKISHILDKFTLLNVLDLQGANVDDSFPDSVTNMILLRYLALDGLTDSIPPSISKLSNLETLIISGKREGVQVPDTIFELKKLRHLQVNPHTHFTTTSLISSESLQLQTLSTPIICCCSVCSNVVQSLQKLRKLECILRGSLKHNGFPDLDSLTSLESLKASYSGLIPFVCKFTFPRLPASLKKISLSKFELAWSEMETLAALPNVEYLKLRDSCFKGKKWDISYEFPSLKYLRLDTLDIEEWEASDNHFPCLEWLIVRGCKRLKAIPSEFSDVGTLKCIEVDRCGRSVSDSAVKIEYEQRNYSGNKQFKAIVSRIEEMVHIGEQANKEMLCSKLGVGLAFHCLLTVWMQNRNSH